MLFKVLLAGMCSLCLVGTATLASAHEFIVKPDKTQAAKGENVGVQAQAAHVFMISEEAEPVETVVVELIQVNAKEPVKLAEDATGSFTAHSSLFMMAIYTLYLSLSRKEKIPSALFNEITISEESPPATIAMFLFIIYSSLVVAYTRHLSINAVMSAGISESKNISSPVDG